MYSKVNTLESLEKAAEKFVMGNDRMLYAVFFETAEHFCAQNSILLGGRVGIDVVAGRPLSKDSFVWDLYCDDTFNMAKKLVIELSEARSPHIPANTAALQTNIRYKEFTIYVNARVLFRIYAVDKYKGVELINIMGYTVRTSYFSRIPIKCVPEEMQLIAIYRTLYTPAKTAQWLSELENESIIYNMIKGSIEDKAMKLIHTTHENIAMGESVTGGRRHRHHGARKSKARSARSTASATSQKPRSVRIAECLLQSVIKPNAYVLIGDYAFQLLGIDVKIDETHSRKIPPRIQFITAADIDDIKRRCERCLQGSTVSYIKYPVNLPNDFQIIKYTLYVVFEREGESKPTAIADVFNSAAFEMVPYTLLGGIRVGNSWVLLRFLFIDIWILKLILNIGNESGIASAMKKIITNVHYADAIHAKIAVEGVSTTFQLTGYAGQYIDEHVAKKKMIKETGERFPIFYPAKPATYPMGGTESDHEENGQERGGHIADNIRGEIIGTSHPSNSGVAIKGQLTGVMHNTPTILHSRPIDLSVDPASKKKILMKVVGRVIEGDILKTLHYHENNEREYSKWGTGKSIKGFYYKNAQFLPFIPQSIDVYVDIGCGDGLDIAAIRQKYTVNTAVCVDIDDFRDDKYKSSGAFLKVELGEPLGLDANYADLVVVFHSLHHMQDDALWRLTDIVRITRIGGLIFIKDHDVKTPMHASNVDFEHLAYEIGHAKDRITGEQLSVERLMETFDQYEPMTYYRREDVHTAMETAGCTLVWTGIISNRNYVYGSVFKKNSE